MNIKQTLVSIILPTYNGNHVWLSQAIDSVIEQTYTDRELIIINDASTNGIEKTILEYVKKDTRIIYHKNKINLKLTKTLNKWISLSQWTYIARIDDDDMWCDSKKLEKQVNFMEKNPDYGLCGTSWYIIDENNKVMSSFFQRESNKDIKNNLLSSNQFTHTSVMIRKNCLNVVWIYNPIRNLVEDYDLRLRIGMEYKMYNFQDQCVYYRINTQSVSHKNYYRQQKLNSLLTFIFKNYYPWFLIALIKKIGYVMLPQKVSQSLLTLLKKWTLKQ